MKALLHESPSDQDDNGKMIQFLEATLDGNIPIVEENEKDDNYSPDSWHRLVLLFFDTNSHNAPTNKILDWIGRNEQQKHLTQEIRFGWHEWIMKFTVESIARKNKQCSYLRDPKAMDILDKIMMAHAVSPVHDALRSLSWQTISSIVHEIGWKWNNKASTNAPICTWTRLASGEWKILLEQVESGEQQQLSPSEMQTLDGCGLLMMDVVEYLTSLDERPDSPLPLEPESLMHLKQSLEDALSITSLFINLYVAKEKADFVIKTKAIEFWCRIVPEFELDNQRSIDEGFPCLETLSANDERHPSHATSSSLSLQC